MKTPVLPGMFMLHVEELPRPDVHFDGATYRKEPDHKRLGMQLLRVLTVMQTSGRWRTLHEIATITGDPEASISARLRDLRKPKFGGFEIEHRRRTEGLWEYRLVTR